MLQPFLNNTGGQARNPAFFALALFLGGALALFPLALRAQGRDVTGPPREIGPVRGPAAPLLAQSKKTGPRSIAPRPGLNDGGIQVGVLSSTQEANVGLLVAETGGDGQGQKRGRS